MLFPLLLPSEIGYTLKREGPRGRGILTKIGTAVMSTDGDGIHFIKIASLPGGFNGNVYLHPIDEK
jgi:hypothetical protein